tara:strand:- start:1710 stop:3311 length:1602 start_codon:yes stop_codon:yes gene_type:complete
MTHSPLDFTKKSQIFTSKRQIPFIGNKDYRELQSLWSGTGIVTSGGGRKYGTNAYMNLRYIYDVLKSDLPSELWYVGEQEFISPLFKDLTDRYKDKVEIINAEVVARSYPFSGNLRGYPIKPYCMTHSKFETILFIDSDCFLHIQPEDLLNTELYKEHQALFCSDIDLFNQTSGRLHVKAKNYQVPKLGTWNQHTHIWDYSKPNPIWNILQIREDDLPEFESGLICMNKTLHIDALLYSLFLNENHDFIYNYVCGDKDTFKLAWSKFGNKLNLISDVRPNKKYIEGFLENRNVYQHRVIDAKFNIAKLWSEYPNNLNCIDKGHYKTFFEDASTLMGNSMFESAYIQPVSTSELMPGSTREKSLPYIKYVNKFIQENNIKSILDVGCGDGLMISHLDLSDEIQLTGIDISKIAIKQATSRFQNKENFRFIHTEAMNYDSYGEYDLILIKDVFQHLPYRDIFAIISKCPKAKYYIITNDVPSVVKDIHRGDHRPIDITDIYSEPYIYFDEYVLKGTDNHKNIVTYENIKNTSDEV